MWARTWSPSCLAAGYQVVGSRPLYLWRRFRRPRVNPKLTEVKGDLRNPADVQRALAGCDAVIHLACISNDPSFDLEPGLSDARSTTIASGRW